MCPLISRVGPFANSDKRKAAQPIDQRARD
ncbi:hypothetical protein SMB34_09130 [Thalassospira permensis NBRC 106175]|uniref:Uncharacterized protein n=1 Tax=Thalassospira permensis NBRC 106175 TaxID=1353532 RepID=A0ABR4TIS4_9PROT|nr:hypothetical protein SMB34_09130 [Thalassospira permensis NBRC 106175]